MVPTLSLLFVFSFSLSSAVSSAFTSVKEIVSNVCHSIVSNSYNEEETEQSYKICGEVIEPPESDTQVTQQSRSANFGFEVFRMNTLNDNLGSPGFCGPLTQKLESSRWSDLGVQDVVAQYGRNLVAEDSSNICID